MTYKKQDRPMCGCGNTQDPNGYCAGTYYYQCSLHGGMVGTITVQ